MLRMIGMLVLRIWGRMVRNTWIVFPTGRCFLPENQALPRAFGMEQQQAKRAGSWIAEGTQGWITSRWV